MPIIVGSMKTVEAIIDEHGNVKLLEPLSPGRSRRALVTILEESSIAAKNACLSEAALAQDWDTSKEDEAWSHLQTF